MVTEEFKREPRKKKVPRKVTPKSLENAALYYLQRFSSSSENLRRVMMRRVYRSAKHHDTDPEEGAEILDALIKRYNEVGLLDDAQFAKARAGGLNRRGSSARAIRAKLAEKGVAKEVIDETLERLKDEDQDPELSAAVTLARKRRLGPFRVTDDRLEFKEKDMAILARAGFNYSVAQKIIAAETSDELEEEVEKNMYGS
ncbi:MAG: RecX family transcriptional regulator [Rhodospirillaceae bacterium]|nr:RecX family transcriptional regulator [Rhodospirillaceae bacterium]MBT4939071.1 RecX family transcriptional regulator [Rhodospirillaceae bacterium]MBT5938472.1 RecX family transcriptional regulator [Rhodospirillaceae bacterium]MBT7266947.1 RecX family transcriptional regulator [Rhodospirillaceae bacterium]